MDLVEATKRIEAKRKRQYYDGYRKYWIEHGLCQHCGRQKDDQKYKTCKRCRENSKRYNELYKTVDGVSRKEYVREYARERRERLTAEGLCYVCGKNPVIKGRRICEDCAEKARIYDKKRRART